MNALRLVSKALDRCHGLIPLIVVEMKVDTGRW
jgi:hypothetical protein